MFECRGASLTGILHESFGERGVLVVVGGPQYRVGSHRQFVLLARALAEEGFPVLRFDYRGMGDSEGEVREFARIEEDIHAAVDFFFQRVGGLREVVLWGLCDAASANAYYAFQDVRVKGLVLLNPWVRTAEGEAKTYLRYYYIQRLLERSFWRSVFTLKWNPLVSLQSVTSYMLRTTRGSGFNPEGNWRALPLPERMFYGLRHFGGRVLLIISGRDLTAREFEDAVARSREWQAWVSRKEVKLQKFFDADHTFSQRDWHDQMVGATANWLKSW